MTLSDALVVLNILVTAGGLCWVAWLVVHLPQEAEKLVQRGLPDPGLSLHCGHTHKESATAGDGLSYCPACLPKAVKLYGLLARKP